MVEPPLKRSKRSEQDVDRRRESPERHSRSTRDRGHREDRDERDRFDKDAHRERDRKYRSRSPERDRDRNSNRDRDRERYGGQGRERGGRRDEPRDRDRERERERERERDREPARLGRRDEAGGRDIKDSGIGIKGRGDRDRDQNSRKRPRDLDDNKKRPSRSQSPARDVKARLSIDRSPVPARGPDIEATRETKSRTSTPPVTFKVGHGHPGAGHANINSYKDSNGHDRGDVPAAYDSEVMNTDIPAYDDSKSKKSKGKAGKRAKIEEKNIDEDEDIVVEEDDSMAAMQSMLGFGGFGTTKQKKVVGNDVYAVRKEKKTEYRQYMNRVGGFNRPLSPSRD